MNKSCLTKEPLKYTRLRKKLIGLLRIHFELIRLQKMIKFATNQTNNQFDDYQGILITYRKCFYSDQRGTGLTDYYFKKAPKEMRDFHEKLLNLANENIAHYGKDDYDSELVDLVIDENSKMAIDLDISQMATKPINTTDLAKTLQITELLKLEVKAEIDALGKQIVNEYNNRVRLINTLGMISKNLKTEAP